MAGKDAELVKLASKYFAGNLLSRTEEGLPDADAKLQEASEYSGIGHLLLSPGIIFIIDPKYIKNKNLQRSYGFSTFSCLLDAKK